MVKKKEREMVKSNVWLSTESQPLFTVELNKFDTYDVVEWKRAGKVYEGTVLDRVYDIVDANALLEMYFADYIYQLQHAEVA